VGTEVQPDMLTSVMNIIKRRLAILILEFINFFLICIKLYLKGACKSRKNRP